MELRQLQYFTTVVEEGSISAAARKLHISQPPLSAKMHQLEQEYGVQLFIRGGRQITLTESGSLLYRYAQEILELEQAADADLKNLKRGRRGNIRIGLISSCGCSELYDGIRQFHALHGNIPFLIREGDTYELLDDLKKNRIELAVIRSPYHDADLESLVLRTDPMTAAGRIPDTEGETVRVSDLAGYPIVLYRRWEKLQREAFEANGIHPNIICTCEDARTALQWAEEGIGTALVPSSILSLFPNLPSKPLDEPSLVSSIHLVRIKDAQRSHSADLFYETFREKYAAY